MSVVFTPEGRVQVRTGKVELGQGLHHALAQIVADELGVDIARVDLLPVDTALSPDMGVTSGSQSLVEAGQALRAACAALGRARSERFVGEPLPREALRALFAGAPVFIHDLAPDGLLHGRVIHPRGVLRQAPAEAIRDGQLLGVLAATSAEADAARERVAAAARWDADPLPAEVPADLPHLPATTRTVGAHGTPGDSVRRLRAVYSRPWTLHASIGPSCALAQWTAGGLHVWSHTQGPFNLRRDLALAFGLAPGQVRVTHVPGAGCYGHNGADDVAFDAAWLARQANGQPVRVLWSRADELTHAPQGPAMRVELEAGLDAEGRIVDWRHEVWSPGHSRRPGRAPTPALLGAWQVAAAAPELPSIDMPLAVGGGSERNAVPGYALPAWRVLAHTVATRRRSSALRALGAFANVFAIEGFVDEIAHATGRDPLALRRELLAHDARGLAVLEAACTRAGWAGRARREGHGMGIGYARYKNTGAWCAVVAEVEAGERLRVRRLTIAADVGLAVNPDGVAQQLEGGAIQATSWCLLESAQPAHAGWAEYPILRFADVPAVDVVLVPSRAPSLGAGEAALGPTAGAIGNALFDALGLRVRELPFTPERIVASMETA